MGSHLEKHPYIAPIMLRELASMGRHIPDVVIEDVAQIMTLLSEILVEGRRRHVFRLTNPVLFHYMVVGSIFLSKLVQNVKDAGRLPPWIPEQLLVSLSGDKIDEVEDMALRIVGKRLDQKHKTTE